MADAPPAKRPKVDVERRTDSPSVDEPTVDELYCEGDFSLISSDGIEFKLDKIHLQSASVVLRDTLAIGATASSLELHDGDYEVAETIKIVLNCIYGRTPCALTADGFVELEFALRFADKNDMAQVRQTLLFLLRSWSCVDADGTKKTFPPNLFETGAQHHDPLICRQAFLEYSAWEKARRASDHKARDEDEKASQLQRLDTKADHYFDINSMPLSFVQRILPLYLTAMIRATKGEMASTMDWGQVADQFMTLLRECEG